MFGNVVLEIPKDAFEHEFEAVKKARGVEARHRPRRGGAARGRRALQEGRQEASRARRFRRIRVEQLTMARDAVFRSWMNPRAIEYRRIYDIPDHIGTAVNVQMMVFGNTGDRSATGVGFTRNPATGAKEFYGEFLINAQGEDVVAGIRTPQPIRELEQVMPKAYKQLREITTRLEKHYKDVQDFEFTIQDERLFMLQTRSGKRTGYAAVVIATDLVAEKLITPKEAILLVDPGVAQPAARARLRSRRSGRRFRSPPGACRRRPARRAVRSCSRPTTPSSGSKQGKQVILVRRETVPDDIHGMFVAQGILTATGGMTSHAAVVGRQMGKPSVVGAGALEIDEHAQAVPRRRPDRQGRRLHFVRRPDRRSEDRAGRVEAERDPAGRQRHARRRRSRTSTGGSTSCCRGRTSTGASASARTPTCRIRRSSPTRSARAASACAAPSTCSSARGGSRSCSG